MSARRRRVAAATITADLFAPATLTTEQHAPTIPPLTTAPHAQALSSAMQPLTTVPRAQAVPPRPRQLWYAVVFTLEPSMALLERLSLCAHQFTSLVSIEMPNALLLEIKGSVQLFGSLEVLQAGIDAAWGRFDLRASSATAPTTLAALWLARAGQSVHIDDSNTLATALAELPIACTAWDPAWLHTLRCMGVTRIGELLRLPRAGVSRRLGPAAVLDLDRALAKQSAPRRAFVPRPRFRERGDFETEIETVLYLQKAVQPLIARCARFLRERQAGIQTLELRLRHRVLPVTRVRVGLASITSEHRRLAAVLDEKLQRLALPAPVRGMELSSGWLQPLSGSSLDAFVGLRGAGRDTAPQLVERLRARLGEAAVYRVAAVAEHRPEAAWQRVQELEETRAQRSGVSCVEEEMPRPIWLLSEPVQLSAREPQQLHPDFILEEGPERIESGWWDGRGVARDYYVARQAHGARWWVFQERQTQCWYLHGVFA